MPHIITNEGLPEIPRPNYDYITSTEEALKALEVISRHPIIEVDTETTGLDTFTSKVVLLQIGITGKSFVFDVRDGRVDPTIFKSLLENPNILKILQNAVFDYKMLRYHYGIDVTRMYDLMLAEQLLYLGLNPKSSLDHLVNKYLHLHMPKDVATSFADYNQKFEEYQLRYAANDVSVMQDIYNLQLNKLKQDNLMRVAKLEFDFVKPLSEMELNGMLLDIPKWRPIIDEMILERDRLAIQLSDAFNEGMDQTTLFGVSLVNLDSPVQIVKIFNRLGIPVSSTDVKELNKYKNNPIVDLFLQYRKYEKFITTYGEPMIDRIHPVTNRLHTSFKQMVATGRMSSSNPNLQNIPKEQKYRSCFIARPGYKLITADMDGAELRIIADMSGDPEWVRIFNTGGDLHTVSAAYIFEVSEEEVLRDKALPDDDPNKRSYRTKSKPLSFGLAYGLTEVGLALRLGVSESQAKEMINKYFKKYPRVKQFLEKSGKKALTHRYSVTASGRRRYFRLPPSSDPMFNRVKGSVERAGKNCPIQGCLGAGTIIKGCGSIDDLENKVIDRFETGFGINSGVGVNSGKKILHEMKLSNGVKLNITLDHKIPVIIDGTGEIVDKRVADIDTQHDMLLVPLDIVDGKSTDVSGYKYIKGHWRETYAEYKYPSVMNEKLAFIIGCLIGDGNYTKHNQITFVCPDTQKELLDKFNYYIKEVFGYTPITNEVSNKKNILWRSQISSVVIRGFLKHVGLDYAIHRQKSIPKCFFTESLVNKCALLNGLFSTDGGVTLQSGPNYTTVSHQLAIDIQQLLFSVGINSNLKNYVNEYGPVYRIQVPKRFLKRFVDMIGSSVYEKHGKLMHELNTSTGNDNSMVPSFIPSIIYQELKHSNKYKKLTYHEKCHLRRFKDNSCSFTSWRKFYNLLPESRIKKYLHFLSNYDFCKIISLSSLGLESEAYDVVCDKDPHYFTANGIVVHNSNADTIKQALIYASDRIKDYDARLLLTVHDEMVVEAREDQVEEVKEIIGQSVIDGFGEFFKKVPMTCTPLVGDCWLKG